MRTKRFSLNTGWQRIATAETPAKIKLFSENYKNVEIHVGAKEPIGWALEDFFPMSTASDWVLLFSPSSIWARMKPNAGMDAGFISVLAPTVAPSPVNAADVKQ